MAESVISYDQDLPEIPGRIPWERPGSYLVKDNLAPYGWREETSERRPSQLLLVPKIRKAVDAWRDGGYPGTSGVTQRLFEYWFEEDHDVPGFDAPFHYYFCQREAVETLVWLAEIAGERDTKALIEAHGTIFRKDLLSKSIEFQTTMDGRRQLRRYVPELDSTGVQDLPPKDLRRFAFKMATGLGKDLGHGNGRRLGPIPQATRARLGPLHELPDRRAQRDRVSAAGEGFCRQSDISQAALDSAGVERELLAKGDLAGGEHRARSLG